MTKVSSYKTENPNYCRWFCQKKKLDIHLRYLYNGGAQHLIVCQPKHTVEPRMQDPGLEYLILYKVKMKGV